MVKAFYVRKVNLYDQTSFCWQAKQAMFDALYVEVYTVRINMSC